MNGRARSVLTTAALTALLATAAAAQQGATREGELPGPLADIGFDQRPGNPLPLDLVMHNADGAEVVLGDLFGERPIGGRSRFIFGPSLDDLLLRNDGIRAQGSNPLEIGAGAIEPR